MKFFAEGACKNPHRHSERSEGSRGFIFKLKIKRGDPTN